MAKKSVSITVRRKHLEIRIERLMDKIDGHLKMAEYCSDTTDFLEKHLRKLEKALEALKSRCKHKKGPQDLRFTITCPECGFKFRPI